MPDEDDSSFHYQSTSAAKPLVPILIVRAWIPAVSRCEALVGISIIAITWGGIDSVTRIPATKTMARPPGSVIIPIVVTPIMPVTMSTPVAMSMAR